MWPSGKKILETLHNESQQSKGRGGGNVGQRGITTRL